MYLPSGKQVYDQTPITHGSNFSWGEATKNLTRHIQDLVIGGQLIATALEIENNIVEAAKELDRIRSLLGNRPLHVNSWYRPSHVNFRVGGSSRSRHLYGDAIDLRSNYLHPHQIFKILDRLHDGGLGHYYSFTHIDFRGYKARW